MQTQAYQRPLELFATRSWRPYMESRRELRIVAGGQAGVDRGALDAAMAVGLEVASPRHPKRTRMNVQDSDATLILTLDGLDSGTKLTADTARRLGKPCLVIDLDAADALEKTRVWMAEVRPHVLNIAGPRDPKHAAIYGRAFAFLSRVFKR